MAIKLDLKDKKILFELDKDSSAPLSNIARKVGLSKEVVFHRINNLLKNNVILRFQTIVSTYRLGYRSYKFYFKLQNINASIRKRIEDYFQKKKLVYWIGNCQGRWDMIIAFWAKDIKEIGEFEDDILNKFSQYIQERTLSISRKSMQYNRRWFYNDKKEIIETGFGEDLEEVELDEIDIEILKHLANNARIKIVDLAESIDASVTVVAYRIKQMEKNKVILGYKYALNPKAFDYETCKAFISLKNANQEKRNKLINYCKSLSNVLNIVLTIGQWDMEIEFEVKNFDEYYKIISNVQEKFKDIIKSYESAVFYSEPKQIFMPEI